MNGNQLINTRIFKEEMLTIICLFFAGVCKTNIKPASAKLQMILNIKNNIPPIYDELEIISKQDLNKLKKKTEEIGICLFFLDKDTIIVESKLINSI